MHVLDSWSWLQLIAHCYSTFNAIAAPMGAIADLDLEELEG
jgi:hypothetical protein